MKRRYIGNKFDKLIEEFIDNGQLGDYDNTNYSLTLYNIHVKNDVINSIKNLLSKYFESQYNLVVLDKKSEYSNIKIFINF